VGNGVVTSGVGVGLAEGSGVGLIDSDGVSEGVGLALSEAVGVPSGLDVLVVVGVTEEVGVTAGVNTAGGVELDVQAESATQASMVVKPQPTAVSLTRCAVHAMAVRAFIEPPHALGNHHFPVADRRNRVRRQTVWPAFGRGPDWPENSAGENIGDHNGKPRLRHKHAMARPLPKY
jgi:hypothetical protein